MKRTFSVVIEKDEDGIFVGSVPELKGFHTQGDTLDELMNNVQEAVELCLEVQKQKKSKIDELKFVGVQQIEVAA